MEFIENIKNRIQCNILGFGLTVLSIVITIILIGYTIVGKIDTNTGIVLSAVFGFVAWLCYFISRYFSCEEKPQNN